MYFLILAAVGLMLFLISSAMQATPQAQPVEIRKDQSVKRIRRG